jgi:hypothetical protein
MPIWPGSGWRAPWDEKDTVLYTLQEVQALQALYGLDLSKTERDEERRNVILGVINRLWDTPYRWAVPSGPVGAVRNGEHAWKRAYVPHPDRTEAGRHEAKIQLWAYLMICPMKDHGDDAWLQACVNALATRDDDPPPPATKVMKRRR